MTNPMGANAALACHYCATTERDLRPYGPGGSWVCFSCATETPEREAQIADVAHRAYAAQFESDRARATVD